MKAATHRDDFVLRPVRHRCERPQRRANLNAPSTASTPELQKNTLSANVLRGEECREPLCRFVREQVRQVNQAGGQRFGDRGIDAGIVVAKRIGGDAGHAVEIGIARVIEERDTLTANHRDREIACTCTRCCSARGPTGAGTAAASPDDGSPGTGRPGVMQCRIHTDTPARVITVPRDRPSGRQARRYAHAQHRAPAHQRSLELGRHPAARHAGAGSASRAASASRCVTANPSTSTPSTSLTSSSSTHCIATAIAAAASSPFTFSTPPPIESVIARQRRHHRAESAGEQMSAAARRRHDTGVPTSPIVARDLAPGTQHPGILS